MNRALSFAIFFTVFLSLYGLLHFYFYKKLLRAFNMGPTMNIVLIVILSLLLLSPVISNLISESDYSLLSTVLAYITYLWMGALFLLFISNLIIDIYRLIVYLSSRIISPALSRYTPGDTITMIITLLIVAGILIYGSFEVRNIRVEKLLLNTSKLPANRTSFRIVQISDIHFSPTVGLDFAKKIARIVDDLRPDLLVSTGDLIDKGLQNKKQVTALFDSIDAPFGKFATTGNHEFITGIEMTTKFTEKCGFRMLRNEVVKVDSFLNILAVDDPAGRTFGTPPAISEDSVLKNYLPDRLNIFLKHQPLIQKNSIGRFDIQLSGHTHNGQIFPFTLMVRIMYPYMHGLHKLGKNSLLYVSKGTGTWGPPIRFLAQPDITVIDFRSNRP